MIWRLRIPLVLAIGGAATSGVSRTVAEAAEEPAQISFHAGTRAGIRRLRSQKWGLVGINVFNPTDQPADVLATMYFSGDPNLQYARRLWVPAHSNRYSWCPILPPYFAPADTSTNPLPTTRAELKWLLFDRSGPREVPIRGRSGPILESGLTSIDQSRAITAVISDRGADEEAELGEAVSAMRVAGGLPPVFAGLYDDFLPPVVETLEGLDHLVLASDRPASDAAGLAAVRRWVVGGGRLWIMLDRVDAATVELLLGEAFPCHVVGRVGLTRVSIQGVGPEADDEETPPREFEEPVDLVRVSATDVKVTHTVDGWPASFWRKVGTGEVLVTTLGPRAWIRPRTARDPRPRWDHLGSPWFATRPLDRLAARFFALREPPALEPRQFEPYLSEQIGYRIASRGSVIGVLGTFCLVLLGSGTWLARTRRLERMVWIGPIAAALATSALILMGLFARKTVEPTVAVAQLAEVEPGAEDLCITGLMATYNQEASDASLGARRGGTFQLDMTGLEGTARRMVRSDLDAWRWEHLVLPGGTVRTASFRHETKITRAIDARAAFGPEGLTGTLAPGPFRELADAVLATPSRINLAVELDGRGGFRAGADDVLSPGQFIGGTLLSDEQRRRQGVYEQLFRVVPQSTYPDRPLLLAWARPLDMQFDFPDDARQVGSALLSIPLAIERSAPNTRVVIPSPFLPYRSVGRGRQNASAAYSNATREWIELRIPTTTYLRFEIPEQVLPIALDRLALSLRINAPSRTFALGGFAGEESIELATRNGPVGTFRFDVARSDVLELDEKGGLLLAIHVGVDRSVPPSSGQAVDLMTHSAWKIDAVELEVAGEPLGEGQ
ncbi:MAG: hypothetical protein ABIP48_10720 [Planctomycetota bacterium]